MIQTLLTPVIIGAVVYNHAENGMASVKTDVILHVEAQDLPEELRDRILEKALPEFSDGH